MGNQAVADLANQYERSFRMLYEEIGRFNPNHWVTGTSAFLVPVRVAMHLFDGLDYYFCGKPGNEYSWGHRFGGGRWEIAADDLPDSASVVAYGREIEARAIGELGSIEDEDLARPFDVDDSGATLLGHYVYALRHTMHHHGELAALNMMRGGTGGAWE